MPKSWTRKFEDARPPEVKICASDIMGMKAGQKMLIPSPALIDAWLRDLPRGQAGDIAVLREDLARANGAEVTCPLTTGIFLRIVAEKTVDELDAGLPVEAVAPVWRLLDAKAKLTRKLGGRAAVLADQRLAEGLPA